MGYTKEQREAKKLEEVSKIEEVKNDNQLVNDTLIKAIRKQRNQLPKGTDVLVKNGFAGRLVYVSRKDGYEIIFEKFGSEEFLTIEELRSAKNSYPKFFKNNWFIIEDEDVIYDLGLEKYYENSLNIQEFENIFNLPQDEMIAKINKLSNGQKKSLIYKAIEKIEDGTIDSRKIIESLEKALNTELIEK